MAKVQPLAVSEALPGRVLVIVSLLFWHALWGLLGALLAVPLLAILKIFADRIEPLRPVGRLIGS